MTTNVIQLSGFMVTKGYDHVPTRLSKVQGFYTSLDLQTEEHNGKSIHHVLDMGPGDHTSQTKKKKKKKKTE